MNNHYNKFNAYPVVIFWCGNTRIHTVITVHTWKWVLTIPLHLAVLSCFHLLWITWLRAPLRPTGAENRADLLFNSAGERVNIFLHLHLVELVLTTWKHVEEEVTLGFINMLFQWQMEKCYEFYSLYIWPLSQCSLTSFIHHHFYFQSPFICKHQFVLVAGKIT